MDVSVIICTRNRASHLRDTLRSLTDTRVPTDLDIELVVIDNGSTDETASILEAGIPEGLPVRGVVEPTPGLSHARNRGVREASGAVVLFTDDDVRVPTEWIGPMATPILQDEADAVAGGIALADGLRRDWMTTAHTMMLADTEILRTSEATRMVGANMAIARKVFDVVPGFDPHLGAGPESTGFHEETLLSFQLQRAGFRLAKALEITVEHYPEQRRLLYSAFADTAEKQGRSDAYLHHHWYHTKSSRVRSAAALGYWLSRLSAYRLVPGQRRNDTDEGMAPQEMDIRRRIAAHRHTLRLIGTPRRYERLGDRLHHELLGEWRCQEASSQETMTEKQLTTISNPFT
jgi:glycosyltransferase involved in cell wall biosynthesis